MAKATGSSSKSQLKAPIETKGRQIGEASAAGRALAERLYGPMRSVELWGTQAKPHLVKLLQGSIADSDEVRELGSEAWKQITSLEPLVGK